MIDERPPQIPESKWLNRQEWDALRSAVVKLIENQMPGRRDNFTDEETAALRKLGG